MVFHPKARAITEKYQDKCSANYVLPVIKDSHECDSKRRSRIGSIRGKVNKTLGKITKILKYEDKLTWYSARGTFISEMIASNIHPVDVAAMAGNSPNTIYKHYYKNVDQKQVDAKMERTLGC